MNFCIDLVVFFFKEKQIMKLDALVYLIRVSVKILKGERICFQFFQNLFLIFSRPPPQTLSQTHKIHAQNGALGILTFR